MGGNDQHDGNDGGEVDEPAIGVVLYAVLFAVIFLGWPSALVWWLFSDGDADIKALSWSAAFTWAIFWKSFFRQFAYPFGLMAYLRWLIVWPLHKDFGKMPAQMGFVMAQADVIAVMTAHRKRRPD